VSYCLGITDVDPIRYNLYFERFLNPERKDPPDIDIDFAWDERDAVLDSVFEILVKNMWPEYPTTSVFKSAQLSVRQPGHMASPIMKYPQSNIVFA